MRLIILYFFWRSIAIKTAPVNRFPTEKQNNTAYLVLYALQETWWILCGKVSDRISDVFGLYRGIYKKEKEKLKKSFAGIMK